MELTVPLVDRGNGLWGSSSPAWDHLINRESSGRPTVIQGIRDVNSGGNEAEGLFQITPATWKRNGGTDFAPTARSASPQQQAIVAARIFTRNETGSDWGAGRPGRESAADLKAGLVPVGAPAPAAVVPYGLPNGSNSGGYGGNGVKFPQWVYDLGNAFGLKPSTYPGHQESDRNEGGYAPNPQRLNRGIDWAAPGTADEVDRMQRFADYLFSIKEQVEQVIWWNPRTGKRIGVAGGRDVTASSYYDYAGGYDDHRDHVHTRQSHSLPVPGGHTTVPAPLLKPIFTELDYYSKKKVGQGFNVRSRPPVNFFLHTEEGNGTAESLARFCDGSNGVSYHYTLRDGILCDVVDTDYYSWSVLSANVFSINLCFAGSRAGMSRQEWLQREKDIEIAAFIAVQDCRKYGFSTDVIAPPYHQANGISDHKYVTQQLGIGDHTDVGNNFPWDVFTGYVDKYAKGTTTPTQPEGDDMALVPQSEWDAVKKAILEPQQSLSPFRPPGQKEIGKLLDFARWTDGAVHFQTCKELAFMGHQPTLDLLSQVANTDLNLYPDRADDAKIAANVILAAKKSWASPKSVVSERVVNETDPNVQYAMDLKDQEITRLCAANGQLQARVAQLEAVPVEAVPTKELSNVHAADTAGDTTGAKIQKAVDSNMDYTDHVLAMDAAQRTALTRALDSINPAKENA